MKTANDLNNMIESVTGIYDVLCINGRSKIPSYGKPFMRETKDRLQALLNKEGVGLYELELSSAIDFLMPSTTDFSRSWIGRKVANQIHKNNPSVVTLGCSTGLEVYWIIHFILKKGLLLKNTKVRGIDINFKALETARSGVYNKYYFDTSFYNTRGVEDVIIVDETNNTVRFPNSLKEYADFIQANILDSNCFDSIGLVNLDIVVLMNVLKYMNPNAIQQVLLNVNKVISVGGTLITDTNTFNIVKDHPNFDPIGTHELKCIGK